MHAIVPHLPQSDQLYPDNKVHGGIMGPIWGRQDPGEPHVDPMNFDIWVSCTMYCFATCFSLTFPVSVVQVRRVPPKQVGYKISYFE